MKLNRKSVIVVNFIFILILVFFSCIKKKSFPTTPVIDYKDFVNYGTDSAYFSLNFTDGDGDFGLSADDTIGSYSKNSPYYYNLYMKYMFKNSTGNWAAYFNPSPLVNDTQYYKFRVPLILQSGQDKSMDGEVRVKLTDLRPSVLHKEIKYVFYIYDKALNKSNVVTSPVFALP